MGVLWFSKAVKLEDLKSSELRKERLVQQVQQDQLLSRMKRAQDEHDGILAATIEPGIGDAELDIAAYKMEVASKRKDKAEADLQTVLTRLQVIDSTLDIIEQKAALQERGIWKKINDLDEDKLQEQLERFGIERKQSHLNINKIAEMLETSPMDVKANRSGTFRRSREAIDALRAGLRES